MSVTTWTAVGSIGTAVAAAVAALTLLATRFQSREEEAARIRERLRGFKTALTRAAAVLNSGMPLIEAAWHTADALRSRLRESATVEDLWDLLSEDGMALSASVEGWSSSHATVEMAAALNQLVVEQRP